MTVLDTFSLIGSKDRLHRAKTIDLCQNPLTVRFRVIRARCPLLKIPKKEPKLARARSIPEWEVYDSEISQFARKLAAEGLIRSDVSAVDVNVLAGSAPATPLAAAESEVSEQTAPTVDEDVKRDEL